MAASTSSFFLSLAFLLGLALGADSAAGTVAGLGAVGGCMGASELNIWLMLARAGAGGCATAVTKGLVAAAGVRLLGVVDGWLAFLVGFFLLLGVISAGGTGCCGTAGATGCCKDWIKLTTSGACIRLSRVGAGTTGAVGVAAFFGVAFFRPLGVAGAASVCCVAAAAGKGCVGS